MTVCNMLQTPKPPKFETTRQDYMLELREIELKCNKRKAELEVLDKKLVELDEWAKSRVNSSKDFLKATKLKVEFVHLTDKKLKKQIEEKNKELVQVGKAYASVVTQVKDTASILLQLESEIRQNQSALEKIETEVEGSEKHHKENSQDLKTKIGVLQLELSELKKQVVPLRKEVERGNKQVEEERVYLRGWSDYLRTKERDLRLWEIRVARKLKKELPDATLKFKKWGGREKTINTKI